MADEQEGTETGGRRPVTLSAAGLSVAELRERARIAEDFGVGEIWTEQLPDQRDATIVAAEYLRSTRATRVGTAILPVYHRHPVVVAQLAASLDEMSDGRFQLGLGLSHPFVNELMLGYRQGRPLRVMREYVTIVRTLLREGKVTFEGEYFSARVSYAAPRRADLPIYLAGLQPRMIRQAVRMGDGLLLWLCAARDIQERVMPVVRAACAEFGRDPASFPVLATLPAYAGREPDRQREGLRETLTSYAMIPEYRRVLAGAGFAGGAVPDAVLDAITLVGRPAEVRDRLAEFRSAGCTPVPQPLAADRADYVATLEAVL